MTTSIFDIDRETIATQFKDFNSAWNNQDLVSLANFITDDISYSNPSFNFGVFIMKGRQIFGRFDVLKFWKKYQTKLEKVEEEKEIVDIRVEENSYIIISKIHNYNLGVSSTGVFRMTKDLLIDKIDFSNITELKSDKKINIISIQMKQFQK